MWKKTTGWLFEVQKRNGILEEKDRRLYEYAYGVLLGRVAIYLITVILGIATGNWLEMLVFLLPFNRIFLINPSKAKESDLYLGDISIIDGNSVAIKSWEKAVLGNVREFESNSNDIFDIIMRELENDK